MPKLKNCIICGKEFLSYRRIDVCSEACRDERNRRYWTLYNTRRKDGLTRTPMEKVCPVCGISFKSIRGIKFCGDACRKQARKENLRETSSLYYVEHKEEIKEKSRNNKKGLRS